MKLASLSIELPFCHAAFGNVFTRRHRPTFSVEGFTTSEISRIMCEPEYCASRGSQGRKPSGEDRRQAIITMEKAMPNVEEVAEKIYRLETPIPGMSTVFAVYLIHESGGSQIG